MSDSTRKIPSRKAASERPPKPYPEFPLYPHPLGYWSKKIRGVIRHFGRWGRVVGGKLTRLEGDTWREALEAFKVQVDDLQLGRTPRVKHDELTVKDLCNQFLTKQKEKVDQGEIGARMFHDYKEATDLLVQVFGGSRRVEELGPQDFGNLRNRSAERWGPVRLGNTIVRVKSVFKWGLGYGLYKKPVRYSDDFKKPKKVVLRRHRAKAGEKMLEAKECRDLIDRAGVPFRAMILLGLNAGFGNTDVGTLPLEAVDLERGWIDFPRPKTGIDRRCPLWPETVAALREVLAVRRSKKEAQQFFFVNSRGTVWVKAGKSDNLVTRAFSRLAKELGVHRPGLGFYTLRHVFRTVADGAKDPVAIDLIMGHSDPSMAAHYRERIEDDRLRVVTDFVRAWLFGTAPEGDGKERTDSPGDSPGEEEGTGTGAAEGWSTLRLFAPEGGAA